MLILGRKVNEKIIIQVGDVTIRLLVVDIIDDKMRLGIDAPPEAKIYREELLARYGPWKSSRSE